ncbi:hypothetical protein GCM10009634_47350 [Saccharothrix xinjiangensis]
MRVIALRRGFADPAHFTRAFRAAYGLPPGEYRARAAATTRNAPRAGPAGDPDR